MPGPIQTFNGTPSGGGTIFQFFQSNSAAQECLAFEFGVDASTDFADLTGTLFALRRVGGGNVFSLSRGGVIFASQGTFGTVVSTGAATFASAAVTGNVTVGGTLGVTGAVAFTILPTSGGIPLVTLSGPQNLLDKRVSSTGAITGAQTLPGGTTGERPGTPADGMIRYNSTLGQFEGYYGGQWQGVGGGIHAVKSTASVGAGGTITLGTEGFQTIPVQGNGAARTASTTPFGSSAPTNGTEVCLVGMDSTNTLTFTNNDGAKGMVLNGECTLFKGSTLVVQYLAALDRWIEKSRNIISLA